MPEINRQKPLGQTATSKSQSVLDRIQPIKTKLESLIMSLYGNPKTGKTRLAATFPKPVLFIGAEDGTASIVGAKDVFFVHLQRTAEMMDVIHGPVADGKYKTVVVDNGTKLRDMKMAEILGMTEGDTTKAIDHKGFGFANRDQWTECSMAIKGLLRPLLDLGRRKKLNIVTIAHEQNFQEDSKVTENLNPNVGPALGKSVCDWLNAECDYIAQTLIRAQKKKVTRKVGTTNVDSWEDTGKKEYCLRVGPHEMYQTGFRIGLALSMPANVDFIVNPSYEKIIQVIEGRYKERT